MGLTNASYQTVTANYATADGTATTADSDYVSASGSLTFSPGQTSKTVTVTVNGDTDFESNENFYVNLSNVANATVLDGQGEGTILNDDTNDPIPTGSSNSGLPLDLDHLEDDETVQWLLTQVNAAQQTLEENGVYPPAQGEAAETAYGTASGELDAAVDAVFDPLGEPFAGAELVTKWAASQAV